VILAGVVSLFITVLDRGSRAAIVQDDSPQMQTIEQERMAEFYFRILSWLSDITPRAAKPATSHPQSAPVPHVVKSPRQRPRLGRIEFCKFHSRQNPFTNKLCAHNLN